MKGRLWTLVKLSPVLLGLHVFGTSCGSTGSGSLAIPDFSASPRSFTLIPGGSAVTVRYTLEVDEVDPNTGNAEKDYIDQNTNPPNIAASATACSTQIVNGNCIMSHKGEFTEFSFSAPAGATPGNYSVRTFLRDSSQSNNLVDALTLNITIANPLDIVFSDVTFPDASWTATTFSDNTNGGAVVSSQQSAVVGNPAPSRHTLFDWTGGNGQLARVLNLHNAAIYNPSASGAIKSIDCSWEDNLVSATQPTSMSTFIVMQQNGNTYRLGEVGGNGVWKHHSFSNLTSASFTQITAAGPGAGKPDFTASGGPIQFGYLIDGPANSLVITNSAIVAVDNWLVTIHK